MKNNPRNCILIALCLCPWSLFASIPVFNNHKELIQDARDQSLVVLRKAIDRAAQLEDPSEAYALIAKACIINRQPKVALSIIADMSERLVRHENKRPAESKISMDTADAFSTFTKCAALFSKEDRDVHMKRALWSIDRQIPKGYMILPMRDDYKIYRALLSSDANAAEIKPSKLLLRLDPELYLKIIGKQDPSEIQGVLRNEVRDLHEFVCHGKNNVSRLILKYLVGAGDYSVRVMGYYKLYNPRHAAQLSKHPSVVSYLAWSHPHEALKLAAKMSVRRDKKVTLEGVARVWAYTIPDEIETALEHVDNNYHRAHFRRIAKEEKARREKGMPPTSSKKAIHRNDWRTIMREGIEFSKENKNECMKKLTYILKEGTSHMRSCAVSQMLAYDYDVACKCFAKMSEFSSRDEAIARIMSRAGHGGDHKILSRLLDEIKDDKIYISSACKLVEVMVTRWDYVYGDGRVGTKCDRMIEKIDKRKRYEALEQEIRN